ncbi:CBN-NCX-1 protein [Aphelenchoides fujianensis]|nr:CBN-NCX-1 protein [Aphelenchoides fujianensis]
MQAPPIEMRRSLLLLVVLLAAARLSAYRASFKAGVDDPQALLSPAQRERTERRITLEPVVNGSLHHHKQPQPEKCEPARPCKPGLLLPVWEPQEGISSWSRAFRASVYFIAMVYLFLGVSIVADRFMAAIEVITSQEREVKVKKPNGEKTVILVRIWNETISNLSLMALGSSAPEILLSVIEICGNGFEAGDLGPGTIVGSAAFNLFIIIAVCVISVPPGEIRRIKRSGVFYVTVIWSTFAYVWLYLILSVFSPNVVDVWEGVLTFLFFFFTLITAYWANIYAPAINRRFLRKAPTGFVGQHHYHTTSTDGHHAPIEPKDVNEPPRPALSVGHDLEATEALVNEGSDYDAFRDHRQAFYEIFTKIRKEHPDMNLREVGRLTAWRTVNEAPKSRAFRRIQATRKMLGTKLKINARNESVRAAAQNDEETEPLFVETKSPEVTVVFRPCHYICIEDVGNVHLTVSVDRGSIDEPCVVKVDYRTIEGSAKPESDYVATSGTLRFEPHEDTKTISVKIVDRDDYEEDEEFFVQLSNPKAFSPSNDRTFKAVCGPAYEATVIIVDDDHGGSFTFNSEVHKVPESIGYTSLTVNRNRGARGRVTVPYKVTEGKAKKGKDFDCEDGELIFEDRQTTAEIRIYVKNDDEYEKSEDFYIELGQPIWHKENQEGENGADGRPVLGDHTRCKVVIIEDDELKGFVERLIKKTNSSFVVGTSSWKQQFAEAIRMEDDEEEAEAKDVEDADDGGKKKYSLCAYIMHYLNLPWKLLFATIPPTDYANGWICFIVSIVFIGLLTAVIGDVAAMFGCTVGLKDVVTAISLVAVGTSVPDMFASRLATVQDPTADAAIGNVTGSNAVNVFLGIGIAWMLAAIYHAYKGTVFRVEAGSLASSLTLFLIGSMFCIALLAIRRRHPKIQGELGGSASFKYLTAVLFISTWLVYLLYNVLDAYCWLPWD